MIRQGIIIADEHWGAVLPIERFEKEIEICLYDKIDNLERLDFLIIAGDTFDMKEYTSSSILRAVIKHIRILIEKTEKFNTEIVIIEGTRGHDALQTLTLAEIFKDCQRFKVVTTVTSDILCGDIRVLYIPEEYVVDQEVYYNEYFNNRYDIIVGHGMVDKMWISKFTNKKGLEDKTTVPIFKVDELNNIATKCYFGHIHTPREWDNFKYIGSISRWEFGQEEEKGYILVYFDTKTKEVNDEFVANYLSPIMKTKIMNISENITLNDLNIKVDKLLDKYVDKVDKLRVIINLSSKLDNYLAIKDYLNNKFSTYKKVKLILSVDIPEEAIESMKQVIENKRLMNNYLLDKDIPSSEKISKWIKNKKDKDISITEIDEFLNMKI